MKCALIAVLTGKVKFIFYVFNPLPRNAQCFAIFGHPTHTAFHSLLRKLGVEVLRNFRKVESADLGRSSEEKPRMTPISRIGERSPGRPFFSSLAETCHHHLRRPIRVYSCEFVVTFYRREPQAAPAGAGLLLPRSRANLRA